MIGIKVAILHTIAGTLVPLILVSFLTRFFGARRSFVEGLQVWKFAIFAALAMTLPYLAFATFLGPEFPALFGGLSGLAIVVLAAKAGFLVPPPDKAWDFEPREKWDSSWTGTVEAEDVPSSGARMGLFKAWLPYVIVAIMLVATRLDFIPLTQIALPFKGWAQNSPVDSTWLSLPWLVNLQNIFGTTVSGTIQPLYLPGTIFIVVSLMTFFLHRIRPEAYRISWRNSLKATAAASVALVFTVPMVQVFLNTGGGASGFERMPIALADGVAAIAGGAWPILAPFLGGIGAAVAGSNTVSNMMFSLFQFDMGQRIAVDPTWVVALQAVGGAAGNMICVHNVVAASAVVGLLGREGAVIRLTLMPFVYYALVPGAVGYLILRYSQTGLLNAGAFIVLLIASTAVYFIARYGRPTAS
jgi:lactate permease